jgi:hypothetical protein
MAIFKLTNTVVVGMLNATGLSTSIDAGTAAVIRILTGALPADADAAETGTLLATLTCSATAFSGVAANGDNGRATFAAITSDSSADATGTASYFRILTQTAGTVIGQGDAGTSGTSLVLNTTAITAGSTVSITAATIDLPEGA